MKKKSKILAILIPVLFICLMTFVSYEHGMLCNKVYMNGAKTFFRDYRMQDITDTIPTVLKEELLWRFIPLFFVSCILSIGKSPLRNNKTVLISCFCLVLAVCAWFGYIHYDSTDETKDKIKVHLIMQGLLGFVYCIVYNISQTYTLKNILRKRNKLNICNLSISHIIGILASILVHLTTNIALIISQTF